MTFRVLVCAKQVPDTEKIKIDPKTGSLQRHGAPVKMNPDDAHALEAALAIKDAVKDTTVSVLSMGPRQAEDMLFECLAMGADHAVLVSDKALAESDTYATSYVLTCALQKMGAFDLILCGSKAQDGETGQVGPEVAGRLGIPQVSFVDQMEVEPDGRHLLVRRPYRRGHEMVRVKMPCLLTVSGALNVPRFMSIPRIFEENPDLCVWDAVQAGVDPEKAGLQASPTRVIDSFAPEKGGAGVMIKGDSEQETAALLLAQLKKIHAI
ncbi:MAG: electron transfer flavoprotein subunit beta/FixA family protein [Eubacteriales bacterium]|jgi:electron transfer flavoprotein alpha/beta subunit|nr:electron transfer flavoprotein subunit beta/FixA family protein [Eubacteriales bacterium]